MTTDDSINTLKLRANELEAENRRLRQALAAVERMGFSRRDLLVGGAGAVGAVAGSSLLAGPTPALAAPATPTSRQAALPTVSSLATVPATKFYITIIGADQQAFAG